ncbi:hypothetical protein BH10PSE1_BH10PSE1_11970 [soil metagenome]
MQSYEPRIIARGEWVQDENGDTTYIPAHRRPQGFRHEPGVVTGWGDLDHGRETNDALSDEAADPGPDDPPEDRSENRNGYRIRSDAVWDRARADFLAGDTAAAVCDRYDVSLGAFKARAAREGWRRSDQPDPEPVDLETETPVEPEDIATMAAQALIRARRAMDRGRAIEASRWLRVHAQLARLIAVETPRPAKPVRQPDPLDLLTLRMKTAGDIACAAAGLDEDNTQGHAQISRLIAELNAMPTGVSDDSDLSDPVADLEADPDQCLKTRTPVNAMASPASSAAAMTSASRMEPPGWITAVAPAAAASISPSANGKNASDAQADP